MPPFILAPKYIAYGAARDRSGAKAAFPGGGFALRVAQLATSTAIASLIAAAPSLAGPTGGSVVAGQASIQQSGSTTNINQSTNTAIINWQGFSIGRQETVNFNQPSSVSVTLNRVIGNETSVISGALNANGKVFIVNSNGVLFTKGAQVNVGGLVASTLDISNADFMAGHYTFSGSSNAAVVNKGHLHASPGGEIALLGHTVSNDGVIVANLGTVAMASGNKITLNFGGNSLADVTIEKGALQALVQNKRAIIANGGQVIMTAKAADQVLSAQVNNSGIIQARSIGALKGGANGGGHVHIGTIKLIADGGNVNAGGKLNVSARGSANAGSISILAKGGTAAVSGKLMATAQKGNGGTIETSGSKVTFADTAVITTKSASGQTGTWTIDPDGFTIAATLSSSGDGDITGALLSSELATTNITILSTQGAGNYGLNGGDGFINIFDTVAWSSANTLTLNATNGINLGSIVKDSQGNIIAILGAFNAPSGGLTLNAGTDINVIAPSSLQVASLNATAVGTINISAAQNWATINGTWKLTGDYVNINSPLSWTTASTLTLNATRDININSGTKNTSIVTNSDPAVNIVIGTANGSFTAPLGTVGLNAGTDININNASSLQVATLNATAGGNINFNALQNWTGNGSRSFTAPNVNVDGAAHLVRRTLSLNVPDTLTIAAPVTGPANTPLMLAAGKDIDITGTVSWTPNAPLTLTAGKDINIAGSAKWSANTPLTLIARNDININGMLGGSTGTLTLNAASDVYVGGTITRHGIGEFYRELRPCP